MTDAAPAPKDSTELTTASASAAPAGVQAFTFGDAEPVNSRREMLDYIECWHNGRWYEPPVSLTGLARAYRVGPHHESAINIKRNLLVSNFVPHRLLSRAQFEGLVLDDLVFGNAYVERRDNVAGRPLRLERSMAKVMRRGIEPDTFFSIADCRQEHAFAPGSVLQLKQADVNQEIYGMPEYLGALQSAWLNEAATLFRRRYYLNGSHAGFVFYMTDAAQQQSDVDDLRQAMKDSKGPGNFRNMFIYAPNGKKDGIQIIPISEVAAKDEFLGIKNTTRDDVLAAHRVPPQLLGMVPANAGGFGDVGKATEVFERNEIVPLQTRFLAINDWIGEEVVTFRPFDWQIAAAKAAAA
jgi:PBSX family phage portal protein